MVARTTIQEQVVEELYACALELAEEARYAFDLGDTALLTETSNHWCIAMSVEGLRTTTRVMQVLAWLLNQRAYFAGELSKLQLLRDGGLGTDRPSDPDNLALFSSATQAVIRSSQYLHARVRRLDDEQRRLGARDADALQMMQRRLAKAFGAETDNHHTEPAHATESALK